MRVNKLNSNKYQKEMKKFKFCFKKSERELLQKIQIKLANLNKKIMK